MLTATLQRARDKISEFVKVILHQLAEMSQSMRNARCRALFWMVVVNGAIWFIFGPILLGFATINCEDDCDVKLAVGLVFFLSGILLLAPALFIGYLYFWTTIHSYLRVGPSGQVVHNVSFCCWDVPEEDDSEWTSWPFAPEQDPEAAEEERLTR